MWFREGVPVAPLLEKQAEIITYCSHLSSKHQSYSHRQTYNVVGNQVGYGDNGLHPRANENPRGCALEMHRYRRSCSETTGSVNQEFLRSLTYQQRVKELHKWVDREVFWDDHHNVPADSEQTLSFRGFLKDPGISKCCSETHSSEVNM